jgi:hypothetical protein
MKLGVFVLTLVFASVAFAGGNVQAKAAVPVQSKVFIAPMEGNLGGFLAPEIIKKKVPFVLVTEEKDAEFVLTGTSLKEDDKWYHVVFGGKDKNEGNVQLINVASKQIVWAGEAGDRSLWWGGLKRGGERKLADRIVQKMKHDLFE